MTAEKSLTCEIGELIGKLIGSVVKVANPKDDGSRGEVFKVRVTLDISKLLTHGSILKSEGNSHSQAPWSRNPNLNKHTQSSHSVHSGSRLTQEMSSARNASVMDAEICRDNVKASLPSSPQGGLNMPHDESVISISSLGNNRVAESRVINWRMWWLAFQSMTRGLTVLTMGQVYI
nr:hypothetical protein CFP56_74376 [Quercus suber]